jgi:hypothetical protein
MKGGFSGDDEAQRDRAIAGFGPAVTKLIQEALDRGTSIRT